MDQHTNHTDGAVRIAAQLEQDRSALAASLDALRNRFSWDALLSDGTALLRQNAGPYTDAIDRAVRANPLAVGVAAVGIAWMILGRRDEGEQAPALAGTRFEAISRWEDEGGPVATAPDADADAVWIAETETLRARAAALLGRIEAAARDRLAPAAELAKRRADVLASLARDVARVIGSGLDGVSDGVRAQTIVTRAALYDARTRAADLAAAPVRANPALAGVVLAAAGAGLAMALPQTRMEHRVIGPVRDRVVDAARALVAQERLRLAAAVQGVSHELLSEAGLAHRTDGRPPA
jgi:hypothetical protein